MAAKYVLNACRLGKDAVEKVVFNHGCTWDYSYFRDSVKSSSS